MAVFSDTMMGGILGGIVSIHRAMAVFSDFEKKGTRRFVLFQSTARWLSSQTNYAYCKTHGLF